MAKDTQEDYFPVAIGQGMYTSELPSNIPDGFSPVCYNMVASGDSLENRIGIKRSSLDWKVLENAPTTTTFGTDYYNYFVHLFPWEKDSSQPAVAWGGFGFAVPGGAANTNTLNMLRASGVAGAGDGFLSTTLPSRVLGICQYQDNIYFSLSGAGIQKITAINWTLDTITYSNIASAGAGSYAGLFTFKDRLWGWGAIPTTAHRLYYTAVPTVGGLPETWASSSQFVQFVGPNGKGEIKKVLPIGNRLIIFTSNGLYTLLVEGSPTSWILRLLDSKSICTTSQCAFESKNIVYYVNTVGVWATNGQAATKLSGTIEDQWFLAKGARVHTICSYEDGMIVSVAKLATNNTYFDKENCKVFYSKIDPVGWTEWNFNRNELGDHAENLCMVWSTTDKIPTYLNAEPSVYVMAFVSDNLLAGTNRAVAQVLVMDGGVDEYVDRSNNVRSIPVGVYFKTKSFDGGNQWQFKGLKQGYLEIFTSDSEHDFTVSWDNDFTTSEASEIESSVVEDFTVGVGTNLIPIRAGFKYRRAALNFRATLQTPTSQIKIKDVTILQSVSRPVHEQVN